MFLQKYIWGDHGYIWRIFLIKFSWKYIQVSGVKVSKCFKFFLKVYIFCHFIKNKISLDLYNWNKFKAAKMERGLGNDFFLTIIDFNWCIQQLERFYPLELELTPAEFQLHGKRFGRRCVLVLLPWLIQIILIPIEFLEFIFQYSIILI